MKKSIITSLLLLTCALSFSQSVFNRRFQYKPEYPTWKNTTELGVSFGLTAFMGDLGGTRGEGEPFSKDLNGISMRPHLGLSFSYYPESWMKVTAALNYTTITGADSVIKSRVNQSRGRYNRNLSFRSRVEEFSVNGEIYPLQLLNKTHRETLLKPFVGVGVGVFHFNPKAYYEGEWVALKPLRLEGEGFSEYPKSKEYSLYQVYVPVSLGFKYRLNDETAIAFTTTFRKTFTDYLDDVCDKYVNPTLFDKYLTPENATIAKALYYRGNNPVAPKPGAGRGYANTLDSYTTLFITYSYNFGPGRGAERSGRVGDGTLRVKPYRQRHHY